VFRAPGRHRRCRNSGWVDRHVPRRRVSYPPKDSPHLQPYRVTTAVAPLPFFLRAPCASPRVRCQIRASSQCSRRSPTSRRCSADESVTSCRRCQRVDALSSLGFAPLQGPSDRDSSDLEPWPRAAVLPEWEAYCPNSVAHHAPGWGAGSTASGRGYQRRRSARYLERHTANGGR
jgi:hypothetical protein